MELGIGKEGKNHIAVVGAGGKMGSGIALLVLQQLALEAVRKEPSASMRLTLIDANETSLVTLKRYLREHLKKYAERSINELRQLYQHDEHLIANKEIIAAFMEKAMDIVFLASRPEDAKGANIVFEAIVEDVSVKVDTFKALKSCVDPACCFLTNTSSIPIHILEERAHLQGSLIGFHFYNPPAVQRLLELIVPKEPSEASILAVAIAKQLNKKVVYSADMAGFIGNGHFMREVDFACSLVFSLSNHMSTVEAIAVVNRVTQEFLLRPMGMFQLVDYVGIDVCEKIAKIMTQYGIDPIGNPLIQKKIALKIKGGQYGDGSQKEGFFRYDKKGLPISIYDDDLKDYVPYDEAMGEKVNRWLDGKPPLGFSWKLLHQDPQRKEKIRQYMHALGQEEKQEEQNGLALAQLFIKKSQEIGRKLVDDGVARSIEDVDTVLTHGFFHLYGINEGAYERVS